MWSGMNEDFIPFKLAVKLRDKGFRELCLLHYESTGGFYSNSIDTYNRPNQELDYSDFLKCFNKGNSIGLIDAPTISQVLKWLRNTYNLHVETYPCGLGMWKFLVTNITTLEERALCDKYTSSEQAAIVGIEYVLDNLI